MGSPYRKVCRGHRIKLKPFLALCTFKFFIPTLCRWQGSALLKIYSKNRGNIPDFLLPFAYYEILVRNWYLIFLTVHVRTSHKKLDQNFERRKDKFIEYKKQIVIILLLHCLEIVAKHSIISTRDTPYCDPHSLWIPPLFKIYLLWPTMFMNTTSTILKWSYCIPSVSWIPSLGDLFTHCSYHIVFAVFIMPPLAPGGWSFSVKKYILEKHYPFHHTLSYRNHCIL
jgi:hypothetical protein